jgi:hypothetical protein
MKHNFTMLSITVSAGLQSKAEIGESNLTSLSCQTYGALCPLLPNNTYLAFSMPDMPLSGMIWLRLNSCVYKQLKRGVTGADLRLDQQVGGVLRTSHVAQAAQEVEWSSSNFRRSDHPEESTRAFISGNDTSFQALAF